MPTSPSAPAGARPAPAWSPRPQRGRPLGWRLQGNAPYVHVAFWYNHRPQSYDAVDALRSMYIPYSYMEPLGVGLMDLESLLD